MNKKIEKCGVLSYPKSGRTWIRLFFEYYSQYIRKRRAVRVVFAHHEEKHDMQKRVLLIRHPCDVMVSFFLHQKARRVYKHKISDFIKSEKRGIPAYNRSHIAWSERTENQIIVRYEDLFEFDAWTRIIDFFEMPMHPDALAKAFESTKFSNIRKNLDEIATFRSAWRYLAAEHGRYDVVNPSNPDAHKFRRGVPGGYVDYIGENISNYILDNFTLGESLEEYAQEYREWSKNLSTS